MSVNAKNLIKNFVFLSLGIGMMYYVLQEQPISETIDHALSMNYWYFSISAIFAISAHFFRALRWKLLINSIGYYPKTSNVFASVLFMYVSNLVFPRSGEVARCGTIYKYENIPVTPLLGTVVMERLVDLLSLLILTIFLVFLQFEVISQIYFDSQMNEMVESVLSNKIIIGLIFFVLCIIIFLLYKARFKLMKISIFSKLGNILNQLKDSFFKLLKLDKKMLFLMYTIAIWVGYIGMFYICFFAFEPTSHLGLAAGITAFIAGSYGMIAPVQGGVGVWQFMVIMALTTLGVASSDATSWANVAFVLMTLITAVFGVIGFIALPIINKKKVVEQ